MDVQKTMEFILEQQAVTAARMERVSAEIDKLKETSEIHARELEVHTEWKLDMSQALQDLAAHTKEAFTVLADKQQITTDNLNILIRTVQEIIPRLPRQ